MLDMRANSLEEIAGIVNHYNKTPHNEIKKSPESFNAQRSLAVVHSERADMVLDQHETSVIIGEEVRRKIRNALLKQHHHQNQKKLANRIPIVRSFADIGKKQSEPHSMDKNGKSTPFPKEKIPL